MGGLVIGLLLTGVLVLVWLVLPGKPSSSKAVTFDGYIELPGYRGLNVMDYLTLQQGRLYVTSETTGDVSRINLSQGDSLKDAKIELLQGPPAAHGVALIPGSNFGFISRSEANVVDVFDTGSMKLLKHIPVEDDADGIQYNAESGLIYVVHGDPKIATLIDPKQMQPVGTIKLGGKPEAQIFDPVTHLLYQNLEDTSKVASIDLVKRSLVAEWDPSGCQNPTSMAIDVEQRRLFLVCKGNAKFAVFNLEDHKLVATLPVGGGPDSVAFDAGLHRLYVTGKDGVLTVIGQQGANNYSVLGSLSLHYGAHTLTLDPQTHKIYVAYASLFAFPRVAVFSPKL